MEHEKHEKHEKHENVLFADECFRIQGAVFEVSRQMGTGFLEAVYQECLAIGFEAHKVPFLVGPPIKLSYKSRPLRQTYRPDFICFGRIILELKAVREVTPDHRAQVLNYLKATGLRVGLLANFGCAPKARVDRLVL